MSGRPCELRQGHWSGERGWNDDTSGGFMTTFTTRKDQIKSFARQVSRKTESVAGALKSAAMVGACEERDRTLAMIRGKPELKWLYEEICSVGVLRVLGYAK